MGRRLLQWMVADEREVSRGAECLRSARFREDIWCEASNQLSTRDRLALLINVQPRIPGDFAVLAGMSAGSGLVCELARTHKTIEITTVSQTPSSCTHYRSSSASLQDPRPHSSLLLLFSNTQNIVVLSFVAL